MKKGDIFFRWFDPKNPKETIDDIWYFINYGIYLAQNKHSATHCGICLEVRPYSYLIAESNENGFKIKEIERDRFSAGVLMGKWKYKSSGIKTKNLYNFCKKLEGKPYAFFDYLKFIVYTITGKKLFKGSSEKMVCSESVSYILYIFGRDIREDKSYKFDYINPAYVYNHL